MFFGRAITLIWIKVWSYLCRFFDQLGLSKFKQASLGAINCNLCMRWLLRPVVYVWFCLVITVFWTGTGVIQFWDCPLLHCLVSCCDLGAVAVPSLFPLHFFFLWMLMLEIKSVMDNLEGMYFSRDIWNFLCLYEFLHYLMLGFITSYNSIQIHISWELVRMCSLVQLWV